MMLVRCVLAPSCLHGLGLFAAEPVAQGTTVWRFTVNFDLLIDPAAHDRQHSEFLQTYAQFCERAGLWLLCGDHARFINHSAKPNISCGLPLSDPAAVDVALRDIAAGDEITQDYRVGERRAVDFETLALPPLTMERARAIGEAMESKKPRR